MSSFYCQCLNVTVHYIGEVDKSKVVKAEELNTVVPKHLQEKTLTPVKLDIGGVTSVRAVYILYCVIIVNKCYLRLKSFLFNL